MAWTKPTYYMSVIAIVGILITSLALVGLSIINSDRITLNADSVTYINTITGLSNDAGYTDLSDREIADSTTFNYLDSDDNSTLSVTDNLATLNIEKERASQTVPFFKIMYNVPNTILVSLGLPVSQFRHVVNIIGYILIIAGLIMIWTKIING